MILAKNNIVVKLGNSPDYAIFNPQSGSFDIMSAHEHGAYVSIGNGNADDSSFTDYLLERGYAYHGAEDELAGYDRAYTDFQAEIDDTQVQLMLIPTYGCNLACVYCYQHGVDAEHKVISTEAVDAFFDYARVNFSGRSKKPFITLFGGEPLINSPVQRGVISYIVDKCAAEGYEMAAVTNGFDFVDYVDTLKKASIKEIQFTLDGSRDVHDRRRATANGKGTFGRVIAGIDAAIKAGFPVNLRTVVDLENIEDLVRLAEYLDAKGWLDLPPERFKTQLGRNYELFSCYAKPQHLMTQVELWAEYSKLSKQYPVLAKFHRPDFYGIRHLVDTGALYMASFDTCPACKTEWVFDLNGEIYGCTASCGRREYMLGTYFPEVSLDHEAVARWQNRSVKTIEKCRGCKYDVICGGGCGVVAANKNGGDPMTPDCRPIREMTEIGIRHYEEEIRAMTEEDAQPSDEAKEACHCGTTNELSPPAETGNACCSGDQTGGCIVCGARLIYADKAGREKCAICGEEFDSPVRCRNGHYVCDTCHIADILTVVEGVLLASTEKDPVKLARQIFDLPDLRMHGPEYHSIVPAILVAAYQNKISVRNPDSIREAIRRGKDVKGGSCGYSGGCGAAIGAGIAVSVIEKATPMSGEERGKTLQMSGQALLDISCHGGPRCCKRDAVTSIRTFFKNSGYFDGAEPARYVCRQFKENKECLGSRCPYYPAVKITAKGK
jgi:uncharacterized protein